MNPSSHGSPPGPVAHDSRLKILVHTRACTALENSVCRRRRRTTNCLLTKHITIIAD